MSDAPYSIDDTIAPVTAGLHRGLVPPEMAGERLDKVLAGCLEGMSRSRVRALLEEGNVQLDGRTISDAAHRVKPGQTYEVQIPEAAPAEPLAQDIPLTIIYEDDDVLVIDKPADLVVHPAAGNPDSTLVNALLHHCGDSLSGVGGVKRPGIVHRLDKDTSGLMAVAKTDRAHAGLSAQFEDRSISRTYQALVWGVPSPRQGRIEGNIARSTADRKKMAVVGAGGKPAVTLYRTVRTFGTAISLIECELLTGRTHQIRVHLTSIGHPLIGDATYGRAPKNLVNALPAGVREQVSGFPRQALHAARLRFVHPVTDEEVQFSSEQPQDLKELLQLLETLP